jgi:hypothetical protein
VFAASASAARSVPCETVAVPMAASRAPDIQLAIVSVSVHVFVLVVVLRRHGSRADGHTPKAGGDVRLNGVGIVCGGALDEGRVVVPEVVLRKDSGWGDAPTRSRGWGGPPSHGYHVYSSHIIRY